MQPTLIPPDQGWRYVHVSEALYSQNTGVTAPTDEANDEIRCVVNAALNNGGAIETACFMGFGLVDSRGRPFTGGKPFALDWEIIPVTAPANASFLYMVAGFTDQTSAANLVTNHQFISGGVNYQPAANPRGVWLTRAAGGALAPAAVGTGSAIGVAGGRALYGINQDRADGNMSGGSCMLYSAAGATLTNVGYNVGGILLSTPNAAARLIVAIGTYGGAEPGGAAAARTIGCKVRYRLHVWQEDA